MLLTQLFNLMEGCRWTAFLQPFTWALILTSLAPWFLLLIGIPYFMAKRAEKKAHLAKEKEKREAAKESVSAFAAEYEEALRREKLVYVHEQRKRFSHELKIWECELKERGVEIAWKWKTGEFDKIMLKIKNSDTPDNLHMANLHFVTLGNYVQLLYATYIENGIEMRISGTTLKEVPEAMYEAYFRALILSKLNIFSLLVEAAKKNPICFDYTVVTEQQNATPEEFNAFIEALNEEVKAAGLIAIGDYNCLEVTLKKF